MKAIVISEQKFDQLFNDTLTRLELQNLNFSAETRSLLERPALKEAVRKFRFEIVKLKDRLISEAL